MVIMMLNQQKVWYIAKTEHKNLFLQAMSQISKNYWEKVAGFLVSGRSLKLTRNSESQRIDASSLILSLMYTQLCYHSIEHFMPRQTLPHFHLFSLSYDFFSVYRVYTDFLISVWYMVNFHQRLHIVADGYLLSCKGAR